MGWTVVSRLEEGQRPRRRKGPPVQVLEVLETLFDSLACELPIRRWKPRNTNPDGLYDFVSTADVVIIPGLEVETNCQAPGGVLDVGSLAVGDVLGASVFAGSEVEQDVVSLTLRNELCRSRSRKDTAGQNTGPLSVYFIFSRLCTIVAGIRSFEALCWIVVVHWSRIVPSSVFLKYLRAHVDGNV